MHVRLTKDLTPAQRERLSKEQLDRWDRVVARYEGAAEERGKVRERLHNVKIKAHLSATQPNDPNWRQRELLLIQLELELEQVRAVEDDARDEYNALFTELAEVIGPA